MYQHRSHSISTHQTTSNNNRNVSTNPLSTASSRQPLPEMIQAEKSLKNHTNSNPNLATNHPKNVLTSSPCEMILTSKSPQMKEDTCPKPIINTTQRCVTITCRSPNYHHRIQFRIINVCTYSTFQIITTTTIYGNHYFSDTHPSDNTLSENSNAILELNNSFTKPHKLQIQSTSLSNFGNLDNSKNHNASVPLYPMPSSTTK